MTANLLPRVAYFVYCERRLVLDRRAYDSWRDIQDAYADYKASLGPWSEQDIVEFFRDDFPPDESHWPFSRSALTSFFDSDAEVIQNRDPASP